MVLMIIFIDMLGIGILIPVIPLLLTDPSAPQFLLPTYLTVEQGFILLGLLTAAFPLAQFFAAPILGQLSDRYGRKRILLFSLAGTCFSYLVFAIAILTKNIPLLFISRIFDGLTGGNIAVAQATIADITKPEDRAKNFGLMGAVFGLGFIIGPFLGGILSNHRLISWFNAATPFWFAAILSLINITFIILSFSETHPGINKTLKINWSKSIINIVHAFQFKSLRTLYTTMFLFNGGFAFFGTFFAVYLIKKFGFNEGDIGNFFAYVGIWIIITQGLVTRLAAKRWNEQQILRVSIMLFSLCTLLFILPTSPWQLYLVTPLFAICNGLTFANLTSLVSRSADAEVQGEVLGVSASVQAFAQSIPPILSGFIAAKLSFYHPIIVSGIVIMFSAFVFIFLFKPAQFHKQSTS